MRSPASIAKAQQHESRFEKQPGGGVSVGFAAHFLGTSAEDVKRLCKVGTLRARRNRHGLWTIDESFLTRWREANPNTDCGSSDGEEQRALARLAAQAPCPSGACEGHWERRGKVVPAFRAGLCRRCYSGRALPLREKEGAAQ